MRLYKNAVILLVVLGLLIGVYVGVNMRGNDKEEEAVDNVTQDMNILELNRDEIKEITVENKEGKLIFEKKEIEKEVQKDNETVKEKVKEWTATYPEGLKINTSRVNSIETNISKLSASKVIEENAEDVAQYGLDNPIRLTVKLNDGTTRIIELGDQTPGKDGYYIKQKDEKKVYTISGYIGDIFKADKNDIRDKGLVAFAVEDITALALDRNGSLVFSATKKREGEFDNWLLTAPIEANTNSAAVGPILESLTSVNVKSYVEENATDLAQYGLDTPHYALTVEAGQNKTGLLIGKEKEKDKEVYAKLADGNEVFTLDISPFNYLDKPLKEIVEAFAYIVNINEVNKILVEIDGKTVVSEIKTDAEDKDNDRFTVDGRDASITDDSGSQPFRKYYQALIGITLSDVEVGAKPEGKPEITFTYHLKKEPGIMKVEFIPKDAHYYYVVKNDKYSNIIVARKKFDEPDGVRAMYKKLIEEMDKQG